jgi:hypothetical protein
MGCKADRSHDREQQSHRGDDQTGRYEPEVVRIEDGTEQRHDEARCQRPRTDRKGEYPRWEATRHACIRLPAIGVRSSIGHRSPRKRGDEVSALAATVQPWLKRYLRGRDRCQPGMSCRPG